jgi:hypothetical protein
VIGGKVGWQGLGRHLLQDDCAHMLSMLEDLHHPDSFCTALYCAALYCCRTRVQGRAWVVVQMHQGRQGSAVRSLLLLLLASGGRPATKLWTGAGRGTCGSRGATVGASKAAGVVGLGVSCLLVVLLLLLASGGPPATKLATGVCQQGV